MLHQRLQDWLDCHQHPPSSASRPRSAPSEPPPRLLIHGRSPGREPFPSPEPSPAARAASRIASSSSDAEPRPEPWSPPTARPLRRRRRLQAHSRRLVQRRLRVSRPALGQGRIPVVYIEPRPEPEVVVLPSGPPGPTAARAAISRPTGPSPLHQAGPRPEQTPGRLCRSGYGPSRGRLFAAQAGRGPSPSPPARPASGPALFFFFSRNQTSPPGRPLTD
jgi:hypothetical protein